MLKSLINWFKESNRWKHLVLAIPVGFFFTFLAVLGAAFAMEFKDCHHSGNNANIPILKWDWSAWDWLDLACTLIGGEIGQCLMLLIITLISN